MKHLKIARVAVTIAIITATSAASASAASMVQGPMPPVEIATVDWGYISPTGSVNVVNYFNPPPQPWSAGFHRGLDLAAPVGAVIVAPAPGIVTFAGSAFGKPTISIAHPDGLISSFEPVGVAILEENPLYLAWAANREAAAISANGSSSGSAKGSAQPLPDDKSPAPPQFVEKMLVRVGDSVAAGTPIGVLGYWPDATGSNASHCPQTTCVHWGVRRSTDNYVDPLWLLGLAAPIILWPSN